MIRTRSTSCSNCGGAGNDNNSNPEGTCRTTPGVIGTISYPAPAEFDDVDQQDHIAL